jgi:predicted phage terminase large subunit-like protein
MLAASGVAGGPRVREILKVPSDSTKKRLLLDRLGAGVKLRLFFEETPRVAVAGSCGSGRMSLPASPSRTRIVQSWDVAMMTGGQNDYSACTTWLTHKNNAYLLHVYQGRLEYPELRCKVIGLAAEHRATTVLIENAGPGINLLQDLRAAMPRGMTRPIGVKPEGSKVDRMAAQSAKIEQHETGKPLHIKGLLRILIPPFPGSNPGAPGQPVRSLHREFRVWENRRHSGG